jgi:type IV pilus assembly protein PilN
MSSIRINLLPHREQKRQARQRQFYTLMISLAILGLAVIALVHGVLAAQIQSQEARNRVLKARLPSSTTDQGNRPAARPDPGVLARKQVVETLQGNRSEAVHLLDQLVRQLPDGIYLRSIRQTMRE